MILSPDTAFYLDVFVFISAHFLRHSSFLTFGFYTQDLVLLVQLIYKKDSGFSFSFFPDLLFSIFYNLNIVWIVYSSSYLCLLNFWDLNLSSIMNDITDNITRSILASSFTFLCWKQNNCKLKFIFKLNIQTSLRIIYEHTWDSNFTKTNLSFYSPCSMKFFGGTFVLVFHRIQVKDWMLSF